MFYTAEMRFQSILNVISKIESNIRALVLLNLLNSLRKRDKMLSKPHILCLFPNSFNKFNFVCLFDLILYVHSTIFQLCGTGLPGLNQY